MYPIEQSWQTIDFGYVFEPTFDFSNYKTFQFHKLGYWKFRNPLFYLPTRKQFTPPPTSPNLTHNLLSDRFRTPLLTYRLCFVAHLRGYNIFIEWCGHNATLGLLSCKKLETIPNSNKMCQQIQEMSFGPYLFLIFSSMSTPHTSIHPSINPSIRSEPFRIRADHCVTNHTRGQGCMSCCLKAGPTNLLARSGGTTVKTTQK